MKMYATFWQRLKAFLWDYLLITCYLILITIIFVFLRISQFFENRIQAQLIGFLIVTLPVTLYYAFSESSLKQGTFGKQKQIIKVANANGGQISFIRALIRNILKFLPWEISHTLIWQINFFPNTNPTIINFGFGIVYLLIGLNVVSLLMTKTNQTLYDLLTKTYVIKI